MEQSQEIAAQMEQAVKQFNEMLETLRPAFEALRESILKIARINIEAIKRIIEDWRRHCLYVKLIRWHFPHRVAKFITNRWPKRWLPTLEVTRSDAYFDGLIDEGDSLQVGPSPVGDWRG